MGLKQALHIQCLISAAVLSQFAPEAVQAQWLPRIASAQALVVLAHQKRAARYRLDICKENVTVAQVEHALPAIKNIVNVGDQADAYLVPAMLDGQQAVQLHGGIGVTDEYIGSHYFKKLTQLELTFGDTLHHLGEVSARMTDTAGVFA